MNDMAENSGDIYEEYNKAMYFDRNEEMLDFAPELLNGDKTVFYAVGLAHLPDENGLVNALRNAGCTVELVTFK